MKNNEIRELTSQELVTKISEEKNLLLKQRINHAVSPLDNPHKIKERKRLIARLNTELQRRKISEESKEKI